MSFANPLILFLLLAPLAVAAWRLLRKGRRSGVRFSAVGRLPARTLSWRTVVAEAVPFVLLAAFACLIVAAARPRQSLGVERRQIDAIALMMVVDVSGSMQILDFAPESVARQLQEGTRLSSADILKLKPCTRLAEVKRLFGRFVDRRPDDLIGLVTFGTYAETRAPLTGDHEMLKALLREVEIPEDYSATAIGDGLGMALIRLKNADLKSKVVILLSDGVNNAGLMTPEKAAETAALYGVKVYAIGVGSDAQRAPVVASGLFGGPYIAMTDATFNPGQLMAIARTTGGRYFAVNDSEGLENALAAIDRLERTSVDAEERVRWRDRFAVPLSLGVVLALAGVGASLVAVRRMA